MSVRLASDDLQPERELSEVLAECRGRGAVVSFVGVARPTTRTGEEVLGLFLDHYPGMTEATLQKMCTDARSRFTGTSVRVVHRCGMVLPGEPIVFVAACSAHRRSAFEAADYLMDRQKTEAAFWKREDMGTGSRWVEPTDRDHLDRARWE